jgi:hypothetical protein
MALAPNNLLSDQPMAAICHALRAWLADPRELRDLGRLIRLIAKRRHGLEQAELDAYSRAKRFVADAVKRGRPGADAEGYGRAAAVLAWYRDAPDDDAGKEVRYGRDLLRHTSALIAWGQVVFQEESSLRNDRIDAGNILRESECFSAQEHSEDPAAGHPGLREKAFAPV